MKFKKINSREDAEKNIAESLISKWVNRIGCRCYCICPGTSDKALLAITGYTNHAFSSALVHTIL